MQKFIQAAKQRAKLFSKNCNLQNFSGFDVTAILFTIFFFVDVDLAFVENVMRFGVCIYLTYKNSYEVTYVPPKNTTECKFIGWVFWD